MGFSHPGFGTPRSHHRGNQSRPKTVLYGESLRQSGSITLSRIREVFGVWKGAKLFFPEEMPELIAEEAKQLWS
jgi:hypothetical protein